MTTRAVELIRVSTQGQADRDTPEIQRKALDALRKSRPCEVVERIEALGVSGALRTADRADLRRLKALSEAKAYDELRVWSIDRLTRAEDPGERFAVYGWAAAAGAVIVDASGRVIDPSDDMGEIDWYLQTLFAARERKKIIARTSAGRLRAAESGHLSQGSPPYGRRFDREAQQWVESPAEMAILRRIAADTLAGNSTREIAAALDAAGVPPPRVSKWSPSTIKILLYEDCLLGRYRVCGFVQQVPPAVDEATAARVRAAVASRQSSTGPKPSVPALIRGMAFCAPCGHRLHVLSDSRKRPPRYACPSKDSGSIRVATADEAIRGALLETLTSKAVLEAAIDAGRDEVRPTGTDSLESLQRESDRLAGQEARLLRLLDDGLVSETVARERLATLRNSARELDARRHQALAVEPIADASPAECAKIAARVGRNLRHATFSEWRELLAIMRVRVEHNNSHLMLKGRLSVCDGAEMASISARLSHFPAVPFVIRIAA